MEKDSNEGIKILNKKRNSHDKEGQNKNENENKQLLVVNQYEITCKSEVIKVKGNKSEKETDNIVCEYPLNLKVNGKPSNFFGCSPENLEELVVGNLFTKGMIKDKNQIKSIKLDKEKGKCDVEVENIEIDRSNYKKIYLNDINYVYIEPIENSITKLKINEIYSIMEELVNTSQVFKKTGGVHTVGIYDLTKIITIKEDVARHNAVDKSIGYCILNGISLKDKIIFISGRISNEMILKVAYASIPIVISKSAPTSLAVDIANKLNITLCGFVRGERVNIYTHPERIMFE